MVTCSCVRASARARAHRTRRITIFASIASKLSRSWTEDLWRLSLARHSRLSVFEPGRWGGVYWYGLMKTKIKRWKRGMPEMDTGDNRRGRLFWGGLLVENRLLDRRWSEFQPLGVAVALWWLLLMLDVARRWVWCMMYDGESWCLERIRYYLC